MSWGNQYFYYECKKCSKKYKYAIDMIPVFGDDFGKCPECGEMNEFFHEGAIIPEDMQYPEVEE